MLLGTLHLNFSPKQPVFIGTSLGIAEAKPSDGLARCHFFAIFRNLDSGEGTPPSYRARMGDRDSHPGFPVTTLLSGPT